MQARIGVVSGIGADDNPESGHLSARDTAVLLSLLLPALLACGGGDEPATPAAPASPPPQGAAPQGPPPSGPAPGGPPLPPPEGAPPPGGPAPGTSGAQLQDPSGFPRFHDMPAPPGPAVEAGGAWSTAEKLTTSPGGGYRPQIVAAPDGRLHAVYYERTDAGDLIRHRHRLGDAAWSAPAHLGFDEHRNWGPDLVARQDGSVVLVFDHALPDFTSRGYLTTWTADGGWTAPTALTPAQTSDGRGVEVGSGHVADAAGDDLAYVWIGKPLDPSARFRAQWRWRSGDTWSPVQAFTDGSEDAWHTNVERRPDGSVLAGWDVGAGGSETTLFIAEGRDGAFGTPEDITAVARPGERVHFAFGTDGVDHLTWFHKIAGRPTAVYTLSGRPGAWGQVQEPSAGRGGFHFDPDIAIDDDGTRVLVWGWDAGDDAELVYSVDRGDGWSTPRKVADIDDGKPGLPSIAVTPDGAFHVVWNQGVRGRSDVWYARLVID